MSKGIGRQIKELSYTLYRPLYWPRRARRAFVLLFPISLVVWLLLCLVSSLVAIFEAVRVPAARFWNGHRRYRITRFHYLTGRTARPASEGRIRDNRVSGRRINNQQLANLALEEDRAARMARRAGDDVRERAHHDNISRLTNMME